MWDPRTIHPTIYIYGYIHLGPFYTTTFLLYTPHSHIYESRSRFGIHELYTWLYIYIYIFIWSLCTRQHFVCTPCIHISESRSINTYESYSICGSHELYSTLLESWTIYIPLYTPVCRKRYKAIRECQLFRIHELYVHPALGWCVSNPCMYIHIFMCICTQPVALCRDMGQAPQTSNGWHADLNHRFSGLLQNNPILDIIHSVWVCVHVCERVGQRESV